MKIGALGELVEEGVQGQRAALHGNVIGARGTQLGRGLRYGESAADGGQNASKTGDPASHKCFP